MATTDGVITLLPPPEGYVVNFDNPTRQGEHEAYYIAGFGLAISFLFFMQRMYVKIFLAGGLQIDDCKFTTCHFYFLFCWVLVHGPLQTQSICMGVNKLSGTINIVMKFVLTWNSFSHSLICMCNRDLMTLLSYRDLIMADVV